MTAPPTTIPLWHIRICPPPTREPSEYPEEEYGLPLDGKRVVVIGGSSGIGLATAKLAALHCADVVIASRDKEKLEKAAGEIGGSVEAHQLDVSDEIGVRAFFSSIGAFDHLATPASDARAGPFRELDSATARAAFDSKFWGQYNSAKYGAPNIRDGGSIVLVAGIYSQRPPTGVAPIAAIDGAIEALGRALAVELAPVRVNVVSPGVIDTPLWNAVGLAQKADFFRRAAQSLPTKRIGKPEDIAQAIVYLMTNTFTTGSTLYPDGGFTLR